MRKRSWLWICTERITARVELENNIIVTAAPIFKKYIGMTKKEFLESLKSKHGFLYKEFKDEPS